MSMSSVVCAADVCAAGVWDGCGGVGRAGTGYADGDGAEDSGVVYEVGSEAGDRSE